MYVGIHVKYPLFLSDFDETWIFSIYFRKNPQISNFVEIRPVRAELYGAYGQTDMTNLIAAFRKFANAHKNRNKQEYWSILDMTPCSLAEYTDASEGPAAVIFKVEDGDSRYLWNVCVFLPDYTALLLIRR
jgi:hypothetical protein